MKNNNSKSSGIVAGEVRASQVIWTFGPGSLIDVKNLSVVALGLQDWEKMDWWMKSPEQIIEPRLLRQVQRVVGRHVKALYRPPIAQEFNRTTRADHEGMPVSVFPRWFRCRSCNLLGSIDIGSSFVVEGKTPDGLRVVHKNCGQNKLPRARSPMAVPSRFLLACSAGHLSDFPWRAFVHDGRNDCTGRIKFYEVGASLQTENLIVKCECGKAKSMAQAFGPGTWSKMKIKCDGVHPHFGSRATRNKCDAELKTILLGASNSWFSKVLSTLVLPAECQKPRTGKGSEIVELLDAAAEDLTDEEIHTLEDMKKVVGKRRFKALSEEESGVAVEDLFKAWRAYSEDPEAFRAKFLEEESEEKEDVRVPEWRSFTSRNLPFRENEFEAESAEIPAGFEKFLSGVVLVRRLKEVRALVGFTRLEAEDPTSGATDQPSVVPLSVDKTPWVPAVEVLGEGIFIRFDEDALELWESRPEVVERENKLKNAHAAWRTARKKSADGFPGIRYALLHTFAHIMIRELSLACGYSAASLRERIYSAVEGEPMAGVLIYTAATDSDGTLGGLVDLGTAENLRPLLIEALNRARICSTDPLCAEFDPAASFENALDLHLAACHACSYVSETSCEAGNRYLDRALLVETMAGSGSAFFDLTGVAP